jgi:tetratricopeptide (TPR) repeat protein
MQRSRLLLAGLVAGAVVLTVIIYGLPKNPAGAGEKESVKETPGSPGFDFSSYLKSSEQQLSQEHSDKLKALAEAGENSQGYLDQMIALWDSAGSPGISAWYFEQKAKEDNTEDSFLKSAYRYFDAYKAANDSAQMAWFTGKAIETYSKVLEINPENLNAKTDLGTLYAEATAEPMKGIMMLREVVTANPNHENAQLNLGFLSMRSGQYDKAIERFEKVLSINPARIDMYIYRGEALVQMGKNKEAIESFKIFRNLTNDPELIKNVDQYIASLEGSAGATK